MCTVLRLPLLKIFFFYFEIFIYLTAKQHASYDLSVFMLLFSFSPRNLS